MEEHLSVCIICFDQFVLPTFSAENARSERTLLKFCNQLATHKSAQEFSGQDDPPAKISGRYGRSQTPKSAAITSPSFQGITEALNSQDNLTLCTSCQSFIAAAVECSEGMTQTELRVRNLQLQILNEMRQLERHVEQHYLEMKKLENSILARPDMPLMEFTIGTGRASRSRNDGKIREEIGAFRTHILQVMNDMKQFRVSTREKLHVTLASQYHQRQSKVQVGMEQRQPKFQVEQRQPKVQIEEEQVSMEQPDVSGSASIHLTSTQDSVQVKKEAAEEPMINQEGPDLCSEFMEDNDAGSDFFPGDCEPDDDDEAAYEPNISGTSTLGRISSRSRSAVYKPDDDDDEEYEPSIGRRGTHSRRLITRSRLGPTVDMHGREFHIEGMCRFRALIISRLLQYHEEDELKKLKNLPIDLRRKYMFKYDHVKGTLLARDVEVTIDDENQALICKSCGHVEQIAGPKVRLSHKPELKMMFHVSNEHLFEELYKCPICSLVSPRLKMHTQHVRYHSRPKPIPVIMFCDICEKPLSSQRSLRDHKWSHMNAEEKAEVARQGFMTRRQKQDERDRGEFPCPTCGKVFAKQDYLKTHEMVVHNDNRERVVCPQCGKSMWKENWAEHEKQVCPPEGFFELVKASRKFVCGVCTKVCISRKRLRIHMGSHNEARNFKCEICQKGFKTRQEQKCHEKRHYRQRDYECFKGCGATFKDTSHRRRHSNICDGTGPPVRKKVTARKSKVGEID